MILVLDRFEGDYAICQPETGNSIIFPRSALPADAHEGDVLQLLHSGKLKFDPEQTQARHKRIEKKLRNLFE